MGAICFHPYSFLGLFTIITSLTLWEFYGVVDLDKQMPVLRRGICSFAGVYLFVSTFFYSIGWVSSVAFLPYLLFLLFVPIAELYAQNDNPIKQWGEICLGQVYVAAPFALLNLILFPLLDTSFMYSFVLAMFVFVWVNDSGAYLVGSLFGKHRLFERISPKKSWEGFWGGFVSTLIVSPLMVYVDSSVAWYHWLALSAFVVVFGVWGDLVESLLKRSIGIKDSGSLLPGHGGMLDRFDSVLFAIPVTYIYIELFIRS